METQRSFLADPSDDERQKRLNEVIVDVASRRNNENGRRNGAAPARYHRVGAVRRSRSQSVFRALRNNRQTVPLD